MILARVPIYGTEDAGRKFWTRLRRKICDNTFRENKIAKAMYVIEVDHDVKAILLTHVDDLIWAAKPEFFKHVEAILREFAINEDKWKKNDFRFCGKEVKRWDNGTITAGVCEQKQPSCLKVHCVIHLPVTHTFNIGFMMRVLAACEKKQPFLQNSGCTKTNNNINIGGRGATEQ